MTNKIRQVAQLLLQNRTHPEEFWPGLSSEKPTSLADANLFFLGAILDYQIDADRAWESARRLALDIAPEVEQVWSFIGDFSLIDWNNQRQKYSLHRYLVAHQRVWRIAKDILRDYGGDPRKIWDNQSIDEVFRRLNKIRAGEQISRMMIGALIDTGKIVGCADVKPDIHVRSVLGRILRGSGYKLSEVDKALDITREMSPGNPWRLDEQLYLIGKSNCYPKKPKCSKCYLSAVCKFFSIDECDSTEQASNRISHFTNG